MEGIILFSDDHIYSADRPEKALFESLREDIPVLGVHNLELAAQAVKSIASFKAIILDWQYSDQKNDDNFEDIGQEVGEAVGIGRPAAKDDAALSFLKANDFYSLIYIYSELDIEETHGPALREKFGNRVKIKQKDQNFSSANIDNIKKEILNDIAEWEESNQNLAVPVMWSAAINESIQKIFKELSFADPNWLKELYDSAADDGIAPELFVIELLQLLLGEAVVQNPDLLQAIEEIGQQPATAIPAANLDAHRKSLSKLFSRLYYSELADTTPVMTGDIFHLDDNTYGIVVTPECDIDYVKNNEGCEFDLLTFKSDGFEEWLRVNKSINDRAAFNALSETKKGGIRKLFSQEMPRFHFLPAIPFLDVDGKNSGVIDFRIASKRVLATELVAMPRRIKINAPFIQQLRQRYLSHIGRVGTAALPLHVRDWNLG